MLCSSRGERRLRLRYAQHGFAALRRLLADSPPPERRFAPTDRNRKKVIAFRKIF
jgi:hypothetical protein